MTTEEIHANEALETAVPSLASVVVPDCVRLTSKYRAGFSNAVPGVPSVFCGTKFVEPGPCRLEDWGRLSPKFGASCCVMSALDVSENAAPTLPATPCPMPFEAARSIVATCSPPGRASAPASAPVNTSLSAVAVTPTGAASVRGGRLGVGWALPPDTSFPSSVPTFGVEA